jgi:hypothetical protein
MVPCPVYLQVGTPWGSQEGPHLLQEVYLHVLVAGLPNIETPRVIDAFVSSGYTR